ncbi:MAG: large-conductance mechanosensitive channel protein MscL [Candidatus Kapabacteria bacterium]|nr:large-conductance mechanosensitive channel protein MscL [Candidatus Kapabacteria bacterium]
MIQEFKEFAIRGNVIDLAVGVIIGGAFGKIVASLVNDIIMPPIGLFLGGVNFYDLAIVLKAAAPDSSTPAVCLKYGAFLQTVFDFVLLAVTIFAMVKAINTLKRKETTAVPPSPPEPSIQEKLLMEIRDALLQGKSSQ